MRKFLPVVLSGAMAVSFSQIAFAFAVTPRLLVLALVYSLLMGLIGGMLPAFRAARLPVVTALREL